MFGEQPIYTGG